MLDSVILKVKNLFDQSILLQLCMGAGVPSDSGRNNRIIGIY